MNRFISIFVLIALLGLGVFVAHAATPAAAPATAPAAAPMPERSLGQADARITVDEYVSLTCPHCAKFYTDDLPEIKKEYIDTGKVRFVFHDYVRDGTDLKAALLAYCMPKDEFFPFIEMIFKSQPDWISQTDPEKILMSYARLGGLPEDKAKACLADTAMQNSLVADRENAGQEYKVDATPTFVINHGVDFIRGGAPPEEFAKVFEKILNPKK